jgi:hypothetical protein
MSDQGKFSHHDQKVVSVFEVLSAYLTDCYFNHVFRTASDKLARDASLTDNYVRCIQSFAMGIKNDESCYGKLVQSLWRYFTSMTRFTAISFSEFVDRVTENCAPPEYFRQFSTSDKDEILSSMLCDLTINLATYVTRPDMLRRIIDEHRVAPTVTVRMIQDAGVDYLLTKRSALRNEFLKKMGQARDQVPMDAVEDMKKILRRIVKEKAEVAARANIADAECARLRGLLQEMKTRCAKFEKLVQLMQSGRDIGPAAAGAALRAPRPNRLAEPMPPKAPVHKRRERIAEPRSESDAGSNEGDSDEGDEGDDSESFTSSESSIEYSRRKPARSDANSSDRHKLLHSEKKTPSKPAATRPIAAGKPATAKPATVVAKPAMPTARPATTVRPAAAMTAAKPAAAMTTAKPATRPTTTTKPTTAARPTSATAKAAPVVNADFFRNSSTTASTSANTSANTSASTSASSTVAPVTSSVGARPASLLSLLSDKAAGDNAEDELI